MTCTGERSRAELTTEFNKHLDDNVIDFDTFKEHAESKGIEAEQIDDFYDYYQNLNSLEKNLEDLQTFISEE